MICLMKDLCILINYFVCVYRFEQTYIMQGERYALPKKYLAKKSRYLQPALFASLILLHKPDKSMI